LERKEADRMPKKIFIQELEGTRRRGRPRSRKRSSRAGREKMVTDRKKRERHCSIGQGSEQAVVPMEEEVVGWRLRRSNLWTVLKMCNK
jgi:hypothetical protein